MNNQNKTQSPILQVAGGMMSNPINPLAQNPY